MLHSISEEVKESHARPESGIRTTEAKVGRGLEPAAHVAVEGTGARHQSQEKLPPASVRLAQDLAPVASSEFASRARHNPFCPGKAEGRRTDEREPTCRLPS